MRLLILNYEYPPIGGGAGVITQNIAEGLALLGHKVTVVTTWYTGEKEFTEKDNLSIFRLKCKRKYNYQSNPIEMLSWIFASKKFLNKHLLTEQYDICIANFALPGGEVAYCMKLKFKLDYVIISHGHDIPWFMPEQMMWYHAFTYHWIRKICIHSKRNYVQSEYMKTNIDQFLGSHFNYKNKIIFNGWDSSIFKPNYELRSKIFTILFPGRLVPQKDPITFLKAIKLVSKQISNFRVHILGDGKLRSKMQDFVTNNNLTDIVSFKLWVDKEIMLKEYQSSCLTVLPSINEGMSIATLEALSSGHFVIVTDVSHNRYLIKEDINGFFVRKSDPKDISEKILLYYHQKFLNNYIIDDKYIEQFNTTFEWKIIVKNYEQDLLSILHP